MPVTRHSGGTLEGSIRLGGLRSGRSGCGQVGVGLRCQVETPPSVKASTSQVKWCDRLVYTYICFYHRTLSALPYDGVPTLEPGTISRIPARFMAPGHEPPRARHGGDPRVGGRSPRPSGGVYAEPLLLEISPGTRDVPSSGAGPSQNGTCSGGR